jgi:hypothetical protein
MFEFSRFWLTDYEHGRDFVADLDKFLGALPKGWPYGIEMRNRAWLRPDYFDCLTRHQVTQCFQFVGGHAACKRANGAAGEPH